MAKIPALSALFALSEHPPVRPVDVLHMTHAVEVGNQKYSLEPQDGLNASLNTTFPLGGNMGTKSGQISV